MHEGFKIRTLALIAVAALAVFGSGCATSKSMALSKETAAIDAKEGLALATLRIGNVYKTNWQPLAKSLVVKSSGEQGETFAFALGVPYKANPSETDQFEEFLVSVALPAGRYDLSHVHTMATGFMVVGQGFVPIHSSITLAAGKPIYLGRLEVVRRERVGEEPRAGLVIPLIDQSVAGFSGGTWDVKLVDRYDEDLALLRSQYPALKNATVEKQLMPAPRAEPEAAAEAPKAK